MVAFLASISLSLIGSTSRATSPNQLVNVNHGPMVEAPAAHTSRYPYLWNPPSKLLTWPP
jgi:hypothetical protein